MKDENPLSDFDEEMEDENVCSNCGEELDGEICENCSLRCPVCNEVISTFQYFDIGGHETYKCNHLVGNTGSIENDEIFWEVDEYEKKFDSFWEKNSVNLDDMESTSDSNGELFDNKMEALEKFAEGEGLTLLYNATDDAEVCLIIKK